MTQPPTLIHNPIHLFSQHKTYVLTGGLGAVGFEIAKWMYTQGARDIVLMSRTGRARRQQEREIQQTNGAIRVVKADVCNADDVKRVLENKDIGGVIHLAMCLDDDRITKLNVDRFQRVLAPKITGAENLIQQCSNPQQLDFILFFSSISSIIGNPEQANYAAANSFLDQYAYQLSARHSIRARVINLGTVEDVGVIAQDYTLRRVLMTRGLLNQATNVREICEEFIPQMITGDTVQLVPEIDLGSVCDQYPSLRPVFGLLTHESEDDSSEGDESAGTFGEDTLKQSIGQLLQINPDDIDADEKLIIYGVDSLLAVEISTLMKKKYHRDVTQMDILGGMTIKQLLESRQC